MKINTFVATGAAILTSMRPVFGHNYLSHPAAYWTQGYASNGYGSTIDGTIFGEVDGSKYGYGPEGTVNLIKEKLATEGGGSLPAFITKNQKLYSSQTDPYCGLTSYKESQRSKLPATALEVTSFPHAGPCAFYCDDTLVVYEDNCQEKYPGIPALIPYDKAKCVNANRLTYYWIAVHDAQWQVYVDCVWLEGGSGIGSPPSATRGGSAGVKTLNNTSSSYVNKSPRASLPPMSEVGNESWAEPTTSSPESKKCNRRQ
ncbi:uncharacterized protein CCR75_001514 [Bremia lactucae]|uniref:Secreted protein n=1 Tax=Bremia lactucae TaxID=4779 RepID=A0A976FGF2_BRELC|nr:hypothetical protein CCR75_001514 [Bremia lactucae]